MSTTWRIFGITTRSGSLALASLQAMQAEVVHTPVSISASHAPMSGVLSDLLDTDTETEVAFSASVAQAPGFYMDITFAGPVAVDGLRLGAGASAEAFPLCITYGALEDGRVAVPQRIEEITLPSAREVVVLGGGDPYFGAVELLLPLNADAADHSPASRTTEKVGSGAIVSDTAAFGGGALTLNGSTFVRVTPAAAFTFLHNNTTDYTVEIDFFHTASSTTQVLFCTAVASADVGMFIGLLDGRTPYVCFFRGVNGSVRRGDASASAISGAYNTLRLVYRVGAVATLELNGVVVFQGVIPVSVGSFPSFSSDAPTNPLTVGIAYSGGSPLFGALGRICDVRVTKGVVRTGIKTAAWPDRYPQGAHAVRLQTARAQVHNVQGLSVGGGAMQLGATDALDVEHGGDHCIYGTVELYAQSGNIPLPRRVRLQRSRDSLLVRETWSDAQGNYRFDGIAGRYKYDVIAWDHEGLQQSVVANDLAPEPMP